MQISIHENGLQLDILVTPEGDVRLWNCGLSETPMREDSRWMRLLALQASGYNQDDNCGSKHTGTQPGSLLRYAGHTVSRNVWGTKLEVRQQGSGLTAVSHLQLYDGLAVLKSWTELVNAETAETLTVEYLSSFVLTGIGHGERAAKRADHTVHIPHSTWYGEAQWQTRTLKEYGYAPYFSEDNRFSMKRVALSSTGTWPAGEHLPMGAFTDAEGSGTMTWQIETAGSWNWEISDSEGLLYVALSGPSLQENGFAKPLGPSERFVSVPCAVAWGEDFGQTIQTLTRYRRRIRRPNEDNAHPSVIFNDYMNCLWGDPTTEKEIPLIEAAANAGCKYYCVD
ncbi:MAG: alpha-galactosidase, partial [Eubacteriales bacterium]|nr:alpha-galactosidase [Eubacteriales bacterium]